MSALSENKLGKRAHDWHEDVLALHGEAMRVRNLEDVLDFGIYVLGAWFRFADEWHAGMSECPKAFSRDKYAEFKNIERILVECTRHAFAQIEQAKGRGYTVDREDQFNELGKRLLGITSDWPNLGDEGFCKLRDDALRAYQTGEVQEVTNWNE